MPEFKRIGKKIYGASFNAAERAAIDRAIRDQLIEYDKKHMREVDAIVLLELRSLFGFGEKRLRRLYFHFGEAINALLARYELAKEDDVWLATRRLKDEVGIDLVEWEKEWEEENGHGLSERS